MSETNLYNDLINLPAESCDFDHFQSIKLEDFNDDFYNDDSFGSCCSSPTRSATSSDCASPTNNSDCVLSPNNDSSDGSFFSFPTGSKQVKKEKTLKKKQSKLESKVKRNERERRRVRRLAEGFRELRSVVPGEAKKLSKLQTLQNALQYMHELAEMLAENNAQFADTQMLQGIPAQQMETSMLSHPQIWPYQVVDQSQQLTQQQQQLQQVYGTMDQPCIFSPPMIQNPIQSVWYYS